MAQSGGSVVVHIGADVAGLAAGFSKAKGMTQKFGSVAQSTGRMMTRYMTLPIVGMGAASVVMAAKFDQSMRNVSSISKDVRQNFEGTKASVLKMATAIGKSPQDLADGLYDIASSGFDGAAGLKVLEASAKAARAGMSTTKVAAKAITGVLNAYGMSAGKAGEVGDTLFKGVERGVITFEELSTQLGDVISTSAAMGISLEETVGAIAAFTKAGVTGAESVTALNRVEMAFIKPSEKMADFIEKQGYESGQAMLKARGLSGAMDLVAKSTKGNVTALADLFPEVRGIKGALIAVAGGGKLFRQEMNAVKDHAGAMGRALNEQNKGAMARFEKAMARLSVAGIKLGDALIPTLEKVVDVVAKAADWFSALDDDTRGVVIRFGGVVAAAGPLLQVLGGIAKAYASIKVAAAGAGAAQAAAATGEAAAGGAAAAGAGKAAAGGVAATLGPIALIGAALAATGVQFVQVKKNTDDWGHALIRTLPLMDSTHKIADLMRGKIDRMGKHVDLNRLEWSDLLRTFDEVVARQKTVAATTTTVSAAQTASAKTTHLAAVAVNRVRMAQQKYNEAVLIYGKDSDIARAAGAKLADALAKSRAAASKARDAQRKLRDAQIAAGEAAKRAAAKVAILRDRLKEIKDKKIKVKADTSQATSAISRLKDYLAGIHDKTVRVRTVNIVTQLGMGAAGGPVTRTGAYVVGEKGPEMVMLRDGDYVIPNHQLPGTGPSTGGGSPRVAMAGGGDGGMSLNFYGDIILPSVEEPDDFGPALMDYVSGASRAGNLSRRSRGFV